jgi:polyphosphate kinase 2 (PPK2 family)
VLEKIDLGLSMPLEDYERELVRYQTALDLLGRHVWLRKRPVVVVYEGWDASGKGGNIKRVTSQLDPRGYIVHPIAAPKGDEATHHYLWRFWRRLPEKGQIAIFDRSWYGRVMVERVEGFCTDEQWKRAYREINDFERQLVDHRAVVVKYWLHITREEQERRFKERARSPYKSWKLSEEDWRNRARWDEYEAAVNAMVARTSTSRAPWHVVAANDKNAARLEVLEIACQALRARA